MANNPFNRVGKLRPKRNVFDLSYRKNFTCDMGQLIPVVCDEVVPGDYFKIGNEVVVRFQPLAAPIMHEISCHVHYFFVPYRILWDKWEEFISQGQLAGDTPLPIPLPRMSVALGSTTRIGTLWDFFGFPCWNMANPGSPSLTPMDMPWRAYNTVWNEYYRDQDLQLEVDLLNNRVLNRNWKKDYFTAARPFLQKGQAPALPVNVHSDFIYNFNPNIGQSVATVDRYVNNPAQQGWSFPLWGRAGTQGNNSTSIDTRITDLIPANTDISFGVNINHIGSWIQNRSEIHTNATTFNVSDLRLAFQTQKWLERNARAGTRYTEFLQAHFGVSPSDARLDRPEYIGGTKTPVVVSEVLQTSSTQSGGYQGNMSGHGLAADGQYAGSYNVQEYGIIIGLMSVMPKPAYQDGINRQWLRSLPTDFYFPEFAHLSEQAIMTGEVAYSFGFRDDRRTFGYTGQYDEMRVKNDMVCSEMRKLTGNDQLSHWNLVNKFDTVRDDIMLNTEFITCVPRKDVFLVEDVPGLIVNCQNLIRATRPLPLIAEPGLIDHF